MRPTECLARRRYYLSFPCYVVQIANPNEKPPLANGWLVTTWTERGNFDVLLSCSCRELYTFNVRGKWQLNGMRHADRALVHYVRVEWYAFGLSLTFLLDDQFEAARLRMTDLYNAIHTNFETPSYWVDKEQSYYSLYGNFMKVVFYLLSLREKSRRILSHTMFCDFRGLHPSLSLLLRRRKSQKKKKKQLSRSQCSSPSRRRTTMFAVSLFH